ncbi:MAG TPA: hypothetical protein VKZ49_16310 [Polyangiaceae bacterium]|nr:hypothetical protein [Polyangiaceae bacterium]
MQRDPSQEQDVEETTDWEPPSFREILMNAEIGAYQADDSDGNEPI